MGYGTTRSLERVLASCGLLISANLRFICGDDVPQGGVLCALPALLTEGLLRHTRSFYSLPAGYYPLESIFLYLALLALVRCPSLEQTRYEAPGEWGKLLGLDRLPEVRTLREKVGTFCAQEGRAAQWQSRLAKEWMAAVGGSGEEANPEGVGLFYVDGHVRVYHGSLGPLPRRYVARQKLLLRGTTDYWVNGLGGAPFFVVTQAVHAGLIAALREQVLPRLLAEAPQVDAAQLAADPRAMRFTVIFDREGFSPKFFAELSEQRVGVLTYHKYPGEHWPAEEFCTQSVRLPTGEVVERALAERGTQLSNGLWMREVRERSADGSQSSILSNHHGLALTQIAVWMPARWSQENFLKYMREHFGLDRLIEHGTQPLPETTVVVNPAHRRVDQQVRRERGRLQRLAAQFGALTLPPQATPPQIQDFEQTGGQLREQIQAQTGVLEDLKKQRKATPRKVPLKDLPPAERYRQLCPESKHFNGGLEKIRNSSVEFPQRIGNIGSVMIEEEENQLELMKFHWEKWREEANRFWKQVAFVTIALIALDLFQLDVLQFDFKNVKLLPGINSETLKRWLICPISVWLWLTILFSLVDFLRHRVPEKYEPLIHNNSCPIPGLRRRLDLKVIGRSLYLFIVGIYLLILGGWVVYCSWKVWV